MDQDTRPTVIDQLRNLPAFEMTKVDRLLAEGVSLKEAMALVCGDFAPAPRPRPARRARFTKGLQAAVLVAGWVAILAAVAGALSGCAAGEVAPAATDCFTTHGCHWAGVWVCPVSWTWGECEQPPYQCPQTTHLSCAASGLDGMSTSFAPVLPNCPTSCTEQVIREGDTDSCSVTCVPAQ